MLQALNDWTSLLDQGVGTDVVSLDFSKAFDSVCLRKPILKLAEIIIHPRIVARIKEFLSGRSIRVKVNKTFSGTKLVTRGVPQGGVLSPVLFIIYRYELPMLVEKTGVKCVASADDLKLYQSLDASVGSKALQTTLSIVYDWANEWDLPLSKEKTLLLRIGRRNSSMAYYIEGTPITEVEEVKDLGFLLTQNLSFNAQCERLEVKHSR